MTAPASDLLPWIALIAASVACLVAALWPWGDDAPSAEPSPRDYDVWGDYPNLDDVIEARERE